MCKSADHDEKSMLSYYSTMPWLAVPYDADEKEAMVAELQVSDSGFDHVVL